MLRSEVHVERLRALLPRRPEVVVVSGAVHYAFVSPFPAGMAAEVGAPAQDPPGFDRAAFQRRLQREVLAFLQRALR